ncbi:hypothetical protein F5X98DRAFT_242228 [Xylaria grammica]|nr:hypothetical protein F5X98DRAFT_242228 [Xylaria grammica]
MKAISRQISNIQASHTFSRKPAPQGTLVRPTSRPMRGEAVNRVLLPYSSPQLPRRSKGIIHITYTHTHTTTNTRGKGNGNHNHRQLHPLAPTSTNRARTLTANSLGRRDVSRQAIRTSQSSPRHRTHSPVRFPTQAEQRKKDREGYPITARQIKVLIRTECVRWNRYVLSVLYVSYAILLIEAGKKRRKSKISLPIIFPRCLIELVQEYRPVQHGWSYILSFFLSFLLFPSNPRS